MFKMLKASSDARTTRYGTAAKWALGVAVAGCLLPASAVEAGGRIGPRVGQASWYGPGFANRKTASGQRFDPNGLTGAHKTMPLGTQVRVTNLRNGKSVMVTINDRGPYKGRREIDLSYGAARRIGLIERGIERVLIEPAL
jgi:rare lipoprotein A